MKEKEVILNDKTYVVKEMKYLDAVSLDGLEKKELAKSMMKSSTELTDEEIENLSFKDGLKLQEAINEVNDLFVDFQKPTVEK